MRFSLPGLRADDPLGFLAALGILALAEGGHIPELRLAWRGRSMPVAEVTGDVRSIEDLGAALRSVIEELASTEGAIPGIRPDFPLATGGSTTDPMRMTRDELSTWVEHADERWLVDDDPWFARWLAALAGQSAVKDEKRGDVQLSPFYAPTGRMALRNSIFDSTLTAVRSIDGPSDALTRWRRLSYDGANFDERAKRDGTIMTSGKADNQGAPSATWLATMAMRWFTMTDDGHRTATVGWQRIRMYSGFTRRSLVWPMWSQELDPPAVRALLAHPALLLEQKRDDDPRLRRGSEERLRALGVHAVFGSSRRTLSQGDGPLGPARCVWRDLASDRSEQGAPG